MARSLLYIVIALGLAGFIGVGWIALHPPAPPPQIQAASAVPLPPPPAPRQAVLAASRPLRAGALLGPDDITARYVDDLTVGMIIDTPAARKTLIGGMIRQNLPAGTVVQSDNVLRATDRGFLAAVLAPGMLAVTIGVDQVSGVAGLIWPGDHVDVMLSQTLDTDSHAPSHRFSAETLLADVRVIATNQQLMQGAAGLDSPERNIRTLTLEVTSAQAERIVVAGRMGKLSVAVHAALTAQGAGMPPAQSGHDVTWAGDASNAFVGSGGKEGEGLKIFSGPEKSEEVHF